MTNKNVYQNQCSIRDRIDGELNRIAITNDSNEIISMLGHLMENIIEYANISKERIRQTYLTSLSMKDSCLNDSQRKNLGG